MTGKEAVESLEDRIKPIIRRDFFIDRLLVLIEYALGHPESYVREVTSKAIQRDLISSLHKEQRERGYDDLFWFERLEELKKRIDYTRFGPREEEYISHEPEFTETDFYIIVWDKWNPEKKTKKISVDKEQTDRTLDSILKEGSDDFWRDNEGRLRNHIPSETDAWRLDNLTEEEQVEAMRTVPLENLQGLVKFTESCLQNETSRGNMCDESLITLAAKTCQIPEEEAGHIQKITDHYLNPRYSAPSEAKKILMQKLSRLIPNNAMTLLPTIYRMIHQGGETARDAIPLLDQAIACLFFEDSPSREQMIKYSTTHKDHIIDTSILRRFRELHEKNERLNGPEPEMPERPEPTERTTASADQKVDLLEIEMATMMNMFFPWGASYSPRSEEPPEIRRYNAAVSRYKYEKEFREENLPRLGAIREELAALDPVCRFASEEQDDTGKELSRLIEHMQQMGLSRGFIKGMTLETHLKSACIRIFKKAFTESKIENILATVRYSRRLAMLSPAFAENNLLQILKEPMKVQDRNHWYQYKAKRDAEEWIKRERKYITTPPRETEDGFLEHALESWRDVRVLAARSLSEMGLPREKYERFFKKFINDIDPDIRKEAAASLIRYTHRLDSNEPMNKDAERFFSEFIKKREKEGASENDIMQECKTLARSELEDYGKTLRVLREQSSVKELIILSRMKIPGFTPFMRLAEGGSAYVYRAWDNRVKGSDTEVAIKVMKPWHEISPGVKRKLLRGYDSRIEEYVQEARRVLEQPTEVSSYQLRIMNLHKQIVEGVERLRAEPDTLIEAMDQILEKLSDQYGENLRTKDGNSLRQHWQEMVEKLTVMVEEYRQRFRKLFLQDIDNLEKLHHPNLAAIRGKGELKGDTEERTFIAQTYYPKGSLEQILRRKYNIEIPKLIDKILMGLGELHRQGFVHRDLKPANIFLTGDDNIAVIGDLQTCRKLEDITIGEDDKYEGYGLTHGTSYAAPEIREEVMTALSSDVYSMGLIMWDLVSGKRHGLNQNEHISESTHENIVRIMIGQIPKKFTDMAPIIEKCLAYHGEQRYQSAQEILADLKNTYNHQRHEDPVRKEYEKILGHPISEEQARSLMAVKDNIKGDKKEDP